MDTKTPHELYSTARHKVDAAVANVGPRWRLTGGIALALLFVVGLWWIRSGDGQNDQAPPPPPVHVARAIAGTMPVVQRTIGTVIANLTVQVTSRVDGQLESAFFSEGQIVQQGQLLFQLDPRPLQAAYDSAAAGLASAKAKASRYAMLVKQNAIAPQDYDDALAAYKEAVAGTETARLNLSYAQIRAPFTGKTGPILIQPGNLVTANAASPLVTLAQVQPVKVSFALPQSDLPRIQARMAKGGLMAQVDANGSGAIYAAAPVDFVSNAVSDQTGTIELRATFPNTDYKLVPGQLVDVTVTLDKIADATVVPRDAVNTGPEGDYVYRVNAQSKVMMVPVALLFDNGTTDAIKGDIRPGDTVVTEGQLRLVPGIEVSISKTSPASESGAGTPGAQ